MRIITLYGSQTGTAQDVAEYIWRESKKWKFCGPVLSMDDFPMLQLTEEQFAIFIIATTGDGTEPSNMRKSWRFLLRNKLAKDFLKNLKYACLGLGDSSYIKFNYAAKKLNKRLQQLGAIPIIPLGLCDDQHDNGYNHEMFKWSKQLWEKLCEIYNLPETTEVNDLNTFKWNCDVLSDNLHDNDGNNDHILWPSTTKESRWKFRLLNNQRLTHPSHFQDVRLLRFAIPNEKAKWLPGDSIEVQPYNSLLHVNEFFSMVEEHKLGFNAYTTVRITSNFKEMPVPICYSKPLTVKQMAHCIWDLNAKPRQRVLQLLALNCLDELEKERLLEFTTPEGLDDFINYISRPRRTILEVFQDFPHAFGQLTLNVLIEMFNVIQPRNYSIASCVKSETLDLLVAVVEYKTIMAKPRVGLCSNWLKNLQNGDIIWGTLKTGTLRLPSIIPDASPPPLIMIGPGTGIAPFRSIIQNKIYNITEAEAAGEYHHAQQLIVYFGCRYRLKDFYFRNDFEHWTQNSFIKLFVAFSRDQEQKVYVQHLIKDHAVYLKNLIKQSNAYIYVAGSSNNMPKAVREAFLQILDNDQNYIEQLIQAKRYQEETW